MNFLSLCLMTTVLYVSFCDGDLVISNFDKDRHWLVKDDLKLLVEFDTVSDGNKGSHLKARKSEDGIVAYILHNEEIKMFTISKDGKVSKNGALTINGKSQINAFDVEPSGKFVVMSSRNELYFLNQEDKKLSKLLESDYDIEDVLIHPTKRQVYYATCTNDVYNNFLFVYDMDAKLEKRLQLPICFDKITLDSKENIVWASARGSISMLNLTSGIAESMLKGHYDELVNGYDNLFVRHIVEQEENKQTISILKLSKKQQVHKQTPLKDYNIQPALSYFKVSTPVLFNIDEGLIEILDSQFAMTNDKIKLDINKKSIKSIRSFDDDQSTTFFWIHDSNGVVEYVRINHKDQATIKRGTFKFQTERGETPVGLTDFDVFEKEFYLIINNGLFKADIDYSKPEQRVKPYGIHYWSFKSLGIRKEQKKLVIFTCSSYVVGNAKLPLESEPIKYHALAPCPEKILFDPEDDRLIVSTSTGLFNFGYLDHEQIYSGRNIGNFVLDREFVYFVSKIDGPRIYKVPKKRAVKLDHNLQLDEIGFFRIANVKEIVKEGDTKDVNGGNSKDDKKDPQSNGLASEMTSPEKIVLLLSVQFVMHLLP